MATPLTETELPGPPDRCHWCKSTEAWVLARAFALTARDEEIAALKERNQALLAHVWRLRLALGHPQPLLGIVVDEEEDDALA